MLTEDLYPARLGVAPTFLETLALEGGVAHQPERHWERMRRTLEAFASPRMEQVLAQAEAALAGALATLSAGEHHLLHRLTLVYTLHAVVEHRLILYQRRTIKRLVPMELPADLDYRYKYADRSFFQRASSGLAEGEEPLLVRADGRLTDTTFTNVVLDLPEGLLTPRYPLLAGTQRARLLAEGRIREADLTLADLKDARAVYLINALLPLEDALVIPG